MSGPETQGWLELRLHELEKAISDDDLAALKEVISRHSETRSRDEVLADALVISCHQGHHAVVHYLLAEEKAKADSTSKNIPRAEDVLPLILAVKHCEASFRDKSRLNKPADTTSPNGQLKAPAPSHSSNGLRIVKSLLDHGASLLTGDGPHGNNALPHVATVEVAQLLLDRRGEDEFRKALRGHRDGAGNDALMCAILDPCCSEAVAMLYIEHGANKRTVDARGRTTLMNAAWMEEPWKRRTRVLELLLQDKSIAGNLDDQGRNIWHHVANDAGRKQGDETTKLLLALEEADVSVNTTDEQGQTPLHMSAIFGTIAIAQRLLKKKCLDVEAVEKHEGKTALHFAAANGNAEFIKVLLDAGANRFARCNGSLIPLHLVCGGTNDAVGAAALLMESKPGKQLNFRTEEKMTPLHMAAAHGNEGIVKFILKNHPSIDVDARCEGGWTALHLACGRHRSSSRDSTLKYLAVVQALLSARAKVNAKSNLLRTPLHIAAEMGHVEIDDLLLQQDDVQFAAKDSRGNTPLIDAAESNKREQILQLLSPWNKLFVQSLPKDVEQVAHKYDSNIVDFHKVIEQRKVRHKMLRHKLPVANVLYQGCGDTGSLSHKCVSTIPDPKKEDAFRWIHLPANNLHWCHTLLTKHFIEGSMNVESFRALERSLSQQQYRGRRIHSRFMRPSCSKLMRRFGDDGHVHHSATHGLAEDPEIVDLRMRGRTNSTEVSEDRNAPPVLKNVASSAGRNFSGLRVNLEPLTIEDPQTHEKTLKPVRMGFNVPGQMDAVLESGPASVDIPGPKASPTTEKSSEIQTFGACLFMPYLTLESKGNVRIMHSQLLTNPNQPSTTNVTIKSDENQSIAASTQNRDAELHHSYSDWKTNDYCLHVRRTLDQFWYRNVDTGERDGDQVIQRYQIKEKTGKAGWALAQCDIESLTNEVDSLMVDQLWLWVLGPSLIVTSFPQDWQHPREEMPGLLSSILEEIDPRNGTPAQSVYDLAACIVGHCLSSCDRIADQDRRSSVLEMFGSSVGDVMNQEVILFSRFKKASVEASKWVKALSSNKHDTKEAQKNFEKHLSNDSTGDGSLEDWRFTITGEPKFVEVLLDIHTETELLEEVKDIQDELGILLQVVDDQQGVHKEIRDALKPLLDAESGAYQARSSSMLDEQSVSLEQQKVEIENMLKQIRSTYKSITDLLDHKQKHANAFEARYARAQAAETTKQGRTLMVFTIVTVIFLPLSFLAAFFAVALDGLPYNDDNRLPLHFIMKYVVGVGLGTALVFVLIAKYWHPGVRFVKRSWRRFNEPKTRIKRKEDNVDNSTHTSTSSASSITLRSRKAKLHNDLEKGANSVG